MATIVHGTVFDIVSLLTFPAGQAPYLQTLFFLLGFFKGMHRYSSAGGPANHEYKHCMKGKTRQKLACRSAGQAQRLLDGLYRQRGELGDIAHDLISRLKGAGIKLPGRGLRNQNLGGRAKKN